MNAITLSDQTIIWQPQPGPQTALISCPIFEVFFGGARGGGKTESSLGDWLDHSNTYGEAAIGIFVRRKLVQLAEVIARSKQIFSKLGAKYHEQSKTWTMANGARLKFAYLEKDTDAEEYQGHNYTRVYVEEVTNFPSPSPINLLRATLRSTQGVPVGMRLTGNPGGPGHNWVKARYIDPCPAGYRVITESEELILDGVSQTIQLSRVFIPSKLTDNRLLLEADPTYVLRLRQSGSAALVKAWLEGNWNIVDGAFFDEWDPAIHVLDTEEWKPRIPKTSKRFKSFDWGSAKPFSCGWWAISDGTWGLPRGALVRYMEWYGSKGPNVGLKLHVPDVARGILLRDQESKLPARTGFADPSIFITNGGPSIGETFAIHGVPWARADNKRLAGAEQVRARLVGENGKPMVYVLDCCEDTIRTLPVLQHDDKNPEDVDTEAEDHAYDDFRYACMSRPYVPRPPVPEGSRLPKLPGQHTINELIEQLRKKRLAASS